MMIGLSVLFMGGVLLGQKAQKPYTYTFDKGMGNCTFTGVSKDAVWSAVLKALMLEKFQIISAEKQSGTISAQKTLSSFQSAMGVRKDTLPGLNLIFEDRDGGVGVLSSTIAGINWPNKNRQDLEKKLYDKVAELLYGKSDK
jgi:hypothetical protein